MTSFPAVNAAGRSHRARGGTQALVTVNPDLFADIAAHVALRAARRDPPADPVLVDNLAPNVAGRVPGFRLDHH